MEQGEDFKPIPTEMRGGITDLEIDVCHSYKHLMTVDGTGICWTQTK
jgi:hypothetical protein